MAPITPPPLTLILIRNHHMILDTESPLLSAEERKFAQQLAARIARARTGADKTASELYDPRNLPELHHRVDRGDL